MKWLEMKVPPVLLVLLFAAAMLGISRVTPLIDVERRLALPAALALLLLGMLFCLAGVIAFRRARTTVNPMKPDSASSLVVSGIYRVSRNPMYVGFAFCLSALAIYLAAPATLLGVALFVLYMNRFQIVPEERALSELFGAEFLAYRKKVRRWL